MKAEEACREIHQILLAAPTFSSPKDIPFENGLYFFYETGETSIHGPMGRIVRIGNHPRSDDRLGPRLTAHYSGQKNSSVFRKHLGGALLRQRDPMHPCLQPLPGKGHWEKQNAPHCEMCRPIEKAVSERLRTEFRFKLIEIRDRVERNRFETLLIASVSQCKHCVPSENWLGQFSVLLRLRVVDYGT